MNKEDFWGQQIKQQEQGKWVEVFDGKLGENLPDFPVPHIKPKEDPVNHPKHYNNHPSKIECIQVTEHMNFNLGNVVKYLWRTDHKNGLQDLKKAEWYLKREIALREKNENS